MSKKVLVLTVILTLILLLIMPVTILICGFCTGSVFSQTYYGELAQMYSRLKSGNGKKIIIIGNSNVAFGVDSALIENELKADNLKYTVCNFGLYGAIGTKAMLDLSEKYIGKDDVIIFTPELHAQSFSLYFSAKDFLYAADSDFSLLSGVKGENFGAFAGSFPAYTSEKLTYLRDGKQADSGELYAKASFDERCDMKNAKREYNVMPDGVDANDMLCADTGLLDDRFIEYLNGYYKTVRKKGAEMYYSFAPMNRAAFKGDYAAELDGFAGVLIDKLDFTLLGSPHDYVLDYEWFYDSNVHLNASGMTVRSVQLSNDLKLAFGKTTPVKTKLPEKPEIPEESENPTDGGNNSYAEYFTYTEANGGYKINGLTEEGKNLAEIVIPYSYNGKSVTAFDAATFTGNSTVKQITVQSNIKVLYDNSFTCCDNLEKLIILQENPEKLSVGYSLLSGADKCRIYVGKTSFSKYSNDYYWGHYAGLFKTF